MKSQSRKLIPWLSFVRKTPEYLEQDLRVEDLVDPLWQITLKDASQDVGEVVVKEYKKITNRTALILS